MISQITDHYSSIAATVVDNEKRFVTGQNQNSSHDRSEDHGHFGGACSIRSRLTADFLGMDP